MNDTTEVPYHQKDRPAEVRLEQLNMLTKGPEETRQWELDKE